MCPSQFDCGRQPWSWRSQKMPGSCSAELWSVAQLVWRYTCCCFMFLFPTWNIELWINKMPFILIQHISRRRLFHLNVYYICLSSLAVVGTGEVRNVRERPSCLEQSSREHPHWSPHLDYGCQVGRGQWQYSDGRKDHWQSHHFTACKRCGDQQRAVDPGVFLCLSFVVSLTSQRKREQSLTSVSTD